MKRADQFIDIFDVSIFFVQSSVISKIIRNKLRVLIVPLHALLSSVYHNVFLLLHLFPQRSIFHRNQIIMRAIMQGLFLTGFVTQWITSVAFIESSSLRSFGLSRSKSKEALAVRLSARPDIPTVEQLSKDAFMQQVAHADALVHLLDENEDNEELGKLLKAQLSHSDGIRGFFVKYLTGDESPADKPSVPAVLQEAMSQVDANELIPLACKFKFLFFYCQSPLRLFHSGNTKPD